MPTNILVPELGESVVEATVAEWLKQEGEAVAAGEPLVKLETDKVDLEVTAERAGVLARIERQAGEDVKVGDLLGAIEEQGRASPAAPAAGAEQDTPQPAPSQAREKGAPAAAGKVAAAQRGVPAPREDGDERVSPVARRVAEEHGLDLSTVEGSGPQGRVMKEDVERLLAPGGREIAEPPQEPVQPATAPPRPSAARPAPTPAVASPERPAGTDRREERVRMSRRRQTIARRLVEAQQTAAMLTTFNEVDMSAVMEIRKRRKESFRERHGVNLGFMSFFTKASIGALKAFPQINAEIQGNEIVLKHYYDIGIAIGAEEGLVVPVLRDADRMTFSDIEQGIKMYAQKAEEGTLSLEDLRGGTFTITNGGVFGSLLSTPILNPPQVGILGLHKIEERPVAVAGEVVIRPMMYVALSYDHRIVDGREAVQFLVRIKELIEDPETLLLEG